MLLQRSPEAGPHQRGRHSCGWGGSRLRSESNCRWRREGQKKLSQLMVDVDLGLGFDGASSWEVKLR